MAIIGSPAPCCVLYSDRPDPHEQEIKSSYMTINLDYQA